MIKFFQTLLLAIILDLLIAYAYLFYPSIKILKDEYRDAKVHAIFKELVKHTGMFPEIPPLTIVKSPQINAYAAPGTIVIYTGLLEEAPNYDAIAEVLAHEIAHVTLRHIYTEASVTDLDIQHMEANADKLGAFYMMASGYDICKARLFWLKLKDSTGDYLGGDHPGFAYRYSELNVNCE